MLRALYTLGVAGLLAAWGLAATVGPTRAEPTHGIAMHGTPLQPAGFAHFAYVNPDAPKGGRLTLGALGTFDSLNPLILKGVAANGVRGLVYESLLARALDEPFTMYGLIAERVEMADDRSSITYHLNPSARFSDGQPVTVDDVVFSYEILKSRGRPNMRTYYAKVTEVERLPPNAVRFAFGDGSDREMPLILSLMPILPKHRIDPETFERSSLEPPVGTGPYVLADIEAGRSLTYRRNPDYWARDLNVAVGRNNFDEIRYEYFRDASALFEAFKAGQIDLRGEDDPAQWATGYDFPAVNDGRVLKAEFPIGLPAGMSALAFNTRRAIFADQRVRRALILLFDFEWTNRSLYHGLYRRTQSFFARSELSSHGHPADARERELLAAFPGAVTTEIMAGTHSFPVSDGSGRNRKNLRAALDLLKQAGFALDGGRLVDGEGRQFSFEVLIATRSQERLVLNYAALLKRLGIAVSVRQVDSAQYQSRLRTFDFDMMPMTWPASLSPGNEQLFRWSTKAAETEGTFNLAGVKSPAVDAMIEALLAAKEREDFVSAVRALDRVLLSGDYVVPLFHLPRQWVVHWSHLGYPRTTSLYGYATDTWWDKRKD